RQAAEVHLTVTLEGYAITLDADAELFDWWCCGQHSRRRLLRHQLERAVVARNQEGAPGPRVECALGGRAGLEGPSHDGGQPGVGRAPVPVQAAERRVREEAGEPPFGLVDCLLGGAEVSRSAGRDPPLRVHRRE